MENSYIGELIKIFKKGIEEKEITRFIIKSEYQRKIEEYLDLANSSLDSLQFLRNLIVCKFGDLIKVERHEGKPDTKEGLELSEFYMTIITATTSIIDNYIWNKGGNV